MKLLPPQIHSCVAQHIAHHCNTSTQQLNLARMNDTSNDNSAEASEIPSAYMLPAPITPQLAVAPAVPLPVIRVQEHHPKRPNHFFNRMLLCLLAIACNWGTSLRISKYFASSVIEAPPFDAVLMTCRSAYNVTSEERMRYSQCVESRLKRCNRRMDNSIRKEDERVREVSTQNEQVLTNMEEISTSCSRSYTTFRLALQEWITRGGEVYINSNNLECSEADRQAFNETLLGPQNVMALQTEAIDIANTYSEESTEVVSTLASYIVERSEYDANYIDQKTQAIQDAFIDAVDFTPTPSVSIDDLLEELESVMVDLLACISLDENSRQVDGTKCYPNLAKIVNDFHDDAVFKVQVLKYYLVEYRDRMIEYKRNVDAAYKVAKAFYDGVNNVVTKAIIGLFTGSWFDISATDFLAVDVAFPDVDSAFANVGDFESIESLWNRVAPNVGDYYDNLAYISDGLKTRFDDMVDGLVDAYQNRVRLVQFDVPEDYDPPQYVGTIGEQNNDAEEEALLFLQKSKAFQSKSRETLGLFSGIGGQYDEDELDMNVPTFNITEIRNKVTSIELNFESFQQPDFDFDLWFLKLAYLSDGLVLADYIFRAYISLRLISKYWSTSSLAMPQIDIRSNKAMKNPFRHPFLAAIAFVTSPVGGFIIFVASSAWLIGIITTLYVPFLQQYTLGCMRIGDGTFLTKNLFSFAYNHAYQDGSGLLVEGMDAYDIKRGESCSARYASSVTLQNNMNANLTMYTNFYQEVSQDMGLSRRCVNSDALNVGFHYSCLGTAGRDMCPIEEWLDSPLPFEYPGILLNDPSCSVEVDGSDWILSDAIFDCESIPTCSVECELPRKQMLNDASEQCGCTLEWYIHSQWLGTALAFVIYLCMNIARVLFFAGLTRILWKQIHPERFTVVATCNSDGALVTSSHVSGNSHHDLMLAIQTKSNKSPDETASQHELSTALNAKLNRCIRNFYRVGTALLVASFLFNVLWLSFVLLTSRSLTPRVWQQHSFFRAGSD
ncbi:hypothetical protein ACHAWT_007898 [Skeletonema menzelii]